VRTAPGYCDGKNNISGKKVAAKELQPKRKQSAVQPARNGFNQEVDPGPGFVAPVDADQEPAEAAAQLTPKSGRMPVANEAEDRLSRKKSKLEAALKELRDRERGRNLKRFAIVGRAVLAHAGRDPAYKEGLLAVLDAELRKSSERELFGLSSETGTGRKGRRPQRAETPAAASEPPAATGEGAPFMGVKQG
jgi:hypothetical protein